MSCDNKLTSSAYALPIPSVAPVTTKKKEKHFTYQIGTVTNNNFAKMYTHTVTLRHQ